MPLVVPQLRTITIGGAVTGLGIESSSFRNGLPHESVREMRGSSPATGEVVTATPDGEHADLFRALPQLLRHPRLRAAAASSTSSRARRSSACGTCASTTSTRSPPRSASIVAERSLGRRAGRLPRRHRLHRRRGLPHASARWADHGAVHLATTPASTSTTARSSSARPTT